jgi:hypothetical protein
MYLHFLLLETEVDKCLRIKFTAASWCYRFWNRVFTHKVLDKVFSSILHMWISRLSNPASTSECPFCTLSLLLVQAWKTIFLATRQFESTGFPVTVWPPQCQECSPLCYYAVTVADEVTAQFSTQTSSGQHKDVCDENILVGIVRSWSCIQADV